MDTGDRRHGAPRDAAGRDEIDMLFEGANPNPDRTGCPPDSVLVSIVEQRVPAGDPIFDHIETCSPCMQRVRELRESRTSGLKPDADRQQLISEPGRRHHIRWIAAIAAVLLLAVAGFLWYSSRAGRITPESTTAALVEFDLRPYGAMRGEGSESNGTPLELRRGLVTLKMILPTGAEPGHYDIQLLDADLKSRISAGANGELQGYLTQLKTTLDLTDIPPGRYQLALRYQAQRWRLFPAEVR